MHSTPGTTADGAVGGNEIEKEKRKRKKKKKRKDDRPSSDMQMR